MARADVLRLIAGLPLARDQLIEHLHRLQDALGHLPVAHLTALADLLRLAPVEVHEVASFYHHFDVVREGEAPPAAPTVRVCTSLSCALAGGAALAAQAAAALGPGVRVVGASCLGRCDSAPAALCGAHAIAHAGVETIRRAVADRDFGAVVPRPIDYDAYRAAGGYGLYEACRRGDRDAAATIANLDDARLRGLGGAGFPTGRKWRAVRSEPGPRYVVVNIDEGEPGTFKDRRCLELDPHRFIEGALIAAWAVDAASIYVYLRDEYAGCRAMLEHELARLAAAPPAGVALPPIHLRRGAGAYICGEESALIESIEGRRGYPRLRPPYVAQRGTVRPTDAAAERRDAVLGARDPRARRGLVRGEGPPRPPRRAGVLGLRAGPPARRVRRPHGHHARELIDEFAGGMADGHALYAFLPGGASGGILPAALADEPLDFDTLAGHGALIGSAALIVLSQHDRAVDAARNVMAFFRDESCGQCTPCREGTQAAHALMAAPRWDRALLEELCAAMADASICGLGQAAPNPVLSVLRWFAHELEPAAGDGR